MRIVYLLERWIEKMSTDRRDGGKTKKAGEERKPF